MATTNQFGGYASPYNIPPPQDYSSLGNWTLPGMSMYTEAANGMQPVQNSFSDYLSPETAVPGGGVTDYLKSIGVLGSTDTKTGLKTDGWGGLALGTAQGLFSGYMGMKNYGLAKDSLEQGKKQFQMNYDAQKTTTNTALEDRQRARVANNPNSVAVNEYMNQNRIK